MANGFCPAILKHITEVGLTDPSRKLPNLGFLQMLMCCMDGSIGLSDGFRDGHNKPLTVWYRDRIPTSAVADTAATCDNAITIPRKEFALPALLDSSIALFYDDATIRQYCADASSKVRLPGSTTPVMSEVWEGIIAAISAILREMDGRLITQMSTQFGVNVVTGNNAAQPIVTDPTDPYFKTVLLKLLADFRANEFCEAPCMVGNGPFADFETIRKVFGNLDNQGLNPQSLSSLMPRIWEDANTTALWGANQFGAFEKGSLGLITYPKYVGNWAGHRGTSDFFSISVPTSEYVCPPECLDALTFDIQVKELDCAQTITVNGVENSYGPGVLVMISKSYSLFAKPGSLYLAPDPLAGTNGTLRYEIAPAAPVEPEGVE